MYNLKAHSLFNSNGCSGFVGQKKLMFFQQRSTSKAKQVMLLIALCQALHRFGSNTVLKG